MTDVTWNPHPPAPSPAGEGEQILNFLVPLSYGRGARGEGFRNFHVRLVSKLYRNSVRAILPVEEDGNVNPFENLMLRGRNSQFLKKRETSPNSIEVEFSLESKMIEFRIDPKAL